MNLASFPKVFEDDVRRLARGLAKLDHPQLRVARANARLEVRRALETLRRRLNEHFPTVPKAPKPRAAPRPAAKRAQALVQAGWGHVQNVSLIAALSAAGVRVRKLRGYGYFAPRWAVFAALDKPLGQPEFNVARVEQCRRSITARKALLAAHALGGLAVQSVMP